MSEDRTGSPAPGDPRRVVSPTMLPIDGFERIWSTLAVARTLGIPLDVTLTPEQQVIVGQARSSASGPSVAAAPPALPTLSISGSDGPASGGPARGQADLEIQGVLGEGGMGRVLRARQHSLGREVAVKVGKAEADPENLEALLHEATITGSLEHAGVVPVHALGRDELGRPAMVMKRLEGVSWRMLIQDPEHAAWSRLLTSGTSKLEFHLEVLRSVCNAVEFAHTRGVVHRDIKPENVMVGELGEVHLVDWGIAVRMGTASGAEHPTMLLVGTPAYMAPEMLYGDTAGIGPHTDVYLLGATLHEVLTGKPRHDGETLREVLALAFASEPYSYGPEVPAELAAICNRATERDPASRYPTALALRQALSDYVRHRGSIALSFAALERLDELRVRARGTGGRPDEAAAMARLATECRFGFVQALREWSDNEVARAGHESCLELMIELELANRNAAGARALLAELPRARPDLEARVGAGESAARHQAERAERADRIEREFDLSTAAIPRAAFIAFFAALLAAVAIVQRRLPAPAPNAAATMAVLGPVVVPWCVVLPALHLGRKELLRTMISRRLLGAVLVGGGAMVLHRLLAVMAGEQVLTVYRTDAVILAVVAATAGATVLRWAFMLVPIYLGAAVLIQLAPDEGRQIFGGTMALALLAATVFLWRQRRLGSLLP